MHVLLLLLLVRAKTPVIVNWRRLRWGLHHISPVNGNFPESHPGVYPVAVTEVFTILYIGPVRIRLRLRNLAHFCQAPNRVDSN